MVESILIAMEDSVLKIPGKLHLPETTYTPYKRP